MLYAVRLYSFSVQNGCGPKSCDHNRPDDPGGIEGRRRPAVQPTVQP